MKKVVAHEKMGRNPRGHKLVAQHFNDYFAQGRIEKAG